MSSPWQIGVAHLAMVLVNLVFAGQNVVLSNTFSGTAIPPLIYGLYRDMVATPLLLVACAASNAYNRKRHRPSRFGASAQPPFRSDGVVDIGARTKIEVTPLSTNEAKLYPSVPNMDKLLLALVGLSISGGQFFFLTGLSMTSAVEVRLMNYHKCIFLMFTHAVAFYRQACSSPLSLCSLLR
jgi:hypothetical protein